LDTAGCVDELASLFLFGFRYISLYIAKKSSETITSMENQAHCYPVSIAGSGTGDPEREG
jgi:hypothetical protein